MKRAQWSLFLTAVCQVSFVGMQTMFIVHHKVLLLLITGFMISLVWTLNVKRAAFGGWSDRFAYATGAMVGTGIGYYFSNYLVKHL